MLFKPFVLKDKSDFLQHFRFYICYNKPHAADVLGFLTCFNKMFSK